MMSHISKFHVALTNIRKNPPKLDFTKIKDIKSQHANWVIPGILMTGPSPTSFINQINQKTFINDVLYNDINTFICLQEEIHYDKYKNLIPSEKYHNTEFMQISIEDNKVPKHNVFIDTLADIIEKIIIGRKIYLHCYGGHGRTGLYIVALLSCIYKELERKEDALYYFQMTHNMRRIQDNHFYGILPAKVAENKCQQELLNEFYIFLKFL